jgi:hypothetical protein
MNELPVGHSFKKTRGGLVSVLDPEGKPLLYSLNEEQALKALRCLPQFGGVITTEKTKEDYVEL